MAGLVATRRWKNFEDMYNRLDTIPACDRQTDGQKDRRTDILPRQDGYAYASRGKNHPILMKFCTQQQILNWMNVMWSKIKKLHWTDSEFDGTYFLFYKKLFSRWDRRTLPPELRCRCKTVPAYTQFPRNVRPSHRRIATFSAHREFLDYCAFYTPTCWKVSCWQYSWQFYK